MSVDRNYTPAELETQYNARAAVPEHSRIFARWEAASRRARQTLDCRSDLAYGPGRRETLDLFPVGDGAPLWLFIHGGYWQAMDKSYASFLAEPFVARGVAVAVVNYGLCPAVTLDQIADQVRRAVAWLWRHAADYGAAPDRLHVAGHSAGGQLAVLLLATAWTEPGLPAAPLGSAVAVSGVFDLEPLLATSINGALGLDRESARRNSPLYMTPAAPRPLLLAVGELESPEFHRQSRALADAWGGAGMPVTVLKLPDCHHFSAVEQLADPDSPLFAAALDLARS